MLNILNAFNFKKYFFLPPNPNGLTDIGVCIQNLTPTFAYCDVPPPRHSIPNAMHKLNL